MWTLTKNLGIVIALIGTTSPIYAQPASERQGFFLGASIGPSGARFSATGLPSQREGGLSFNWKIGRMVSARMGVVLLGGPSMIYDYSGTGRPRKRGLEGLFASIQYWPTDRLWILGGAGLTTDAPVFFDLRTERADERKYFWGPGAIVGSGYDFWRRETLALDAQTKLHLGYADLPEGRRTGLTLSVSIGLTWY